MLQYVKILIAYSVYSIKYFISFNQQKIIVSHSNDFVLHNYWKHIRFNDLTVVGNFSRLMKFGNFHALNYR